MQTVGYMITAHLVTRASEQTNGAGLFSDNAIWCPLISALAFYVVLC